MNATIDDLYAVHLAVFGQPAQPGLPAKTLVAAILTAVSPLRLDFELARLKGLAIEQEKQT